MNIADENVMATRPRRPVRDTHFQVEGQVVGQVAEDFAQDWAFVTGEDLQGDAWFPDLSGPGDSPGPATDNGGVPARVVASGPDEDLEKIEFALLQAVACAREGIAVMTPYFLPDERLAAALALAAMRGVAMDVVVPAVSDHRLVDWAARANVGPMLDEGVRTWQGSPRSWKALRHHPPPHPGSFRCCRGSHAAGQPQGDARLRPIRRRIHGLRAGACRPPNDHGKAAALWKQDAHRADRGKHLPCARKADDRTVHAGGTRRNMPRSGQALRVSVTVPHGSHVPATQPASA